MATPFRTTSIVQHRSKRTMPVRLSAGQGTRPRKAKRVCFMFQFATPMGYRWVSWNGTDVEQALESVASLYGFHTGWVADILVTEAAA